MHDPTDSPESLRREILELVQRYHGRAFPPRPFVPGQTPVPVSGKVFDGAELMSLVDASLDFWLTSGRFTEEFERRLARFFPIREAVFVNSGSSANLLALSCLTSPTLGEERLLPGDEVITVAAGFPTTVFPILQNRLVPVFVDIDIPTYNVDVKQLEGALTERTRAVMVAHTLGNPAELGALAEFCKRHDLWFIEDCCDALGSRYAGRHVGTFGDLATVSFYPAHHITTGEGGAVVTAEPRLRRLLESFRDWGRDCWCPTGKDNTCGKRFDWQLGELPAGYDHKYIYSHIGYNLKATDMQAAIGVAQLEKLPSFIATRRANFDRLRAGLAGCEEWLILPEAPAEAEPSWFGFPLAVRREAPFDRPALVAHLEGRRIATRMLFAGNMCRQPVFRDVPHRVAGRLERSDFVMTNTFWVGVFPGLTPTMIDFIAETIRDFCPKPTRP